VVTQRDDGGSDVLGDGLASSSCSGPRAVFAFLESLMVKDHDRILEVGTGTGWTAALLSHRIGDQNVTTIEIDPVLAERAAANLKAAGYAPRLVVGDGAEGWPDGAPFTGPTIFTRAWGSGGRTSTSVTASRLLDQPVIWLSGQSTGFDNSSGAGDA
jgi:SAM-dependent methyltransferase